MKKQHWKGHTGVVITNKNALGKTNTVLHKLTCREHFMRINCMVLLTKIFKSINSDRTTDPNKDLKCW